MDESRSGNDSGEVDARSVLDAESEKDEDGNVGADAAAVGEEESDEELKDLLGAEGGELHVWVMAA